MATRCATVSLSVWCAQGSIAASAVTSSRSNSIRQASDSCTWASEEGRECTRQEFLLAPVNVGESQRLAQLSEMRQRRCDDKRGSIIAKRAPQLA
jgi:hypothetical protein